MLWLASEIPLAALRAEVIGSAIAMERVAGSDGLRRVDHHAARRIFHLAGVDGQPRSAARLWRDLVVLLLLWRRLNVRSQPALRRSEEHTSELQSRGHLVCRLLLEKKNNQLFPALVLHEPDQHAQYTD